jgi:hypothetical protein
MRNDNSYIGQCEAKPVPSKTPNISLVFVSQHYYTEYTVCIMEMAIGLSIQFLQFFYSQFEKCTPTFYYLSVFYEILSN